MMPLVCCLLMAVTSFAPTPNVESHESTLIALERMWDQAQVSQDVSAMEDLVADRFINTEWDGVVTNRAGFLADIKNPRLKPTFTSIEAVQVNLYGDTGNRNRDIPHKRQSSGQAIRPQRTLYGYVDLDEWEMAVRCGSCQFNFPLSFRTRRFANLALLAFPAFLARGTIL